MDMTQMRRPWTDEEVTKLMSMAQKYAPAQIASEIDRALASVRTLRTEYLFANGSAPATDNRSRASGLDLSNPAGRNVSEA
jgi:hypothetical protein